MNGNIELKLFFIEDDICIYINGVFFISKLFAAINFIYSSKTI